MKVDIETEHEFCILFISSTPCSPSHALHGKHVSTFLHSMFLMHPPSFPVFVITYILILRQARGVNYILISLQTDFIVCQDLIVDP